MNLRNHILLPLFLLVLLVISIYITATIMKEPFIGAEVKVVGDGQYVVKLVEPTGQAGIEGIRPGDIIAMVDDLPAGENKNVLKFNNIEKAGTVLVRHADGTERLVSFNEGWSGDQRNWERLIQLYIPLASFLLFFSLSVFLYLKRKNDSAAFILMLFFMAIGVSYYSSAASYRNDPIGISIIYLILPNISVLFMAFMNKYISRFQVIFIRKNYLIALTSLFLVISASCVLYVWTDIISNEVFFYVKMVYYASILIGNVIVVLLLISKFLQHRSTKLNSLFKITLVSHLVAFMPFTTMNLIPLSAGAGQIFPAAFTALFLFVLPVVYFYLMTSNQLFDIDFILTRFKYYTFLAFLPSLLVAGGLVFIIGSNYWFSWNRWAIMFIVIYIGMTLFLYAKEQIDQRFRPRLFKAMYSYQDSLDRFSRNIARVMKHDDLEAVLKQEISDLLPVNRIVCLYVDYEDKLVLPIGNSAEEQITADFLLSTVDSFKVGELIDLPTGLALILGRRRNRYHILWVGLKTNHTRFNSDEIRWLKTLSSYASIVFENLNLIEGLIEDLELEVRKEHTTSPWVLRLLFCLSENERRKLAADLHDSALQDQLLWYRKLESIMMDHPLSDKLGKELEEIKEGLLDVIHQIRETCNELRPPLLKEMGVVEAIESIIEHTQMRVNFSVQFRSKPFKKPLNEEQITAIYRIVQELLRNADKHSQAKNVKLELEHMQGTIYFRYEDDGIGMDVNHMVESFEHMGLSGIKERVMSLEGDISFHSERGKGLEVIIIIPEVMANGRSERGISRDSYLIS